MHEENRSASALLVCDTGNSGASRRDREDAGRPRRRIRRGNVFALFSFVLAALLMGAHRSPATVLTVTNLNDSGPGSLRDRIATAANSGDTIVFAVTGTISLFNEIAFSKNLTISGPGASLLTLEPVPGQAIRMFHITGGTSTISDLTITKGRHAGSGSGIYKSAGNLTLNSCVLSDNRTASLSDGGAISNNFGNLTLNNCVLTENQAPNGDGGAIYNAAGNVILNSCWLSANSAQRGGAISSNGTFGNNVTATVTNCVFLSNTVTTLASSGATGGAIDSFAVSANVTLTVDSCLFRDNKAMGPFSDGGAINTGGNSSGATITIRNSTFDGNAAGNAGGGLKHFANNSVGGNPNVTLLLLNCTLSRNLAPRGGAIFNRGGSTATAIMQVTSCTLTSNGNASANGSAIENGIINNAAAVLTIGNTILQRASGASSVNFLNTGGSISSQGYNLSDDGAGGFLTTAGDQIHVDPKLDPVGLQNNGGPTPTIALLSSSPALDRGNNFGITTDQRGMPRPTDIPGFPNLTNGTDIGAYEAPLDPIQDGSAGFLVNTADDHDDGVCGRSDCSLREAINRSNQLSGADTILISFGGTLMLDQPLGPLTVTGPTTITGPGARALSISGGNGTRVFNFSGGPSLLRGLTIRNGRASAFFATPVGGAGLFNNGILTVEECAFVSNQAAAGNGFNLCEAGGVAQGGAVFNGTGGVLTLDRCAFTGNSVTGGRGRECFSDFSSGGAGGAAQGGAIFNESGATLTLSNCTLTSNSTMGGVGGANTGGIGVGGNGGNGEGAGLYNGGTLNVRASTIARNTGAGGPGGQGSTPPRNGTPGASRGGVTHSSGSATMRNSIVALNTGTTAPDVAGAFTSEGYNFIGIGNTATGFNATGDQVGSSASPINPNLGPLQNNGGPTDTLVPATDSPALDKGNGFGLTIDQRGIPRPFDDPAIPNAPGGDGSEIGAVEISPFVLLNAVSRKTHVGAGEFDVVLPGVECRTAGGGGMHTVIFTFSHALASVGNISVTGSPAVTATSGIGFDPRQFVVSLSNVPNGQQLVITLSNLSNQTGGNLSSAGTTIGFLLGDTNGNGTVNATDIGQVKSQSGQPVSATNFRSDVNASGAINATDIGQVKAQSGTALP